MKKHLMFISGSKEELKKFMTLVNSCPGSYKCTHADNGVQALEMLRYLQPNFIFIDTKLEDVSAMQLASAIRFEPAFEGIKMYIYSSEMDSETAKMSTLLGATGYIESNNSFDEVCTRMCAILSGKTQPAFIPVRK